MESKNKTKGVKGKISLGEIFRLFKTNCNAVALFVLLACSLHSFAGNLTVNVTSSSGGSLSGTPKYVVNRGPNYVGTYDAGTTISLVTGATYTIFAHYDGTSTSRTTFVSDAGGDVYNFKTTSVKFNFSGGYLDYRSSGSWSSFGKTAGVWNTRELFPKDFYGNTMIIHTGYVWNDVRGYNFTIDYEGKTSIEKTISILRVFDHNNSPIAGVTFRGGYATPTAWHVPGSTNSDGLLADLRDGNQTNLSYEAKVNNTVGIIGPQNPNTNSYYLFKTVEITLELVTCTGAPLSGGTARYGHGASFGSYFFPAPNSTNAGGVTSAEFFPGTYSFEMNYQSSSQVKSSVTIPNANTTLTWTTTKLTMNWPYDIAYGGSGDSRYFNKPSMELLPGTLNFNFRGVGNNYAAISISGCSMTLKPVVVRLLNSTGGPIAGGLAKYHVSSWTTIGNTGANGNVLMLFDGSVNNAYFNMTYAGGTQQVGSLNINTNPVVTFQTKSVKLELRNSAGNLYDNEGTNVQYHSGSWMTFGTGNTASGICTMELLPVSYYFRMNVFNQTQQKGSINIASLGANPTITFQTVAVTLKLNDAAGTGTHEATCLQYHSGAWYTFGSGATTGSGTETMELLPGNYYFKMKYANQTQQKGSMNINASQTIDFQTVAVTMKLNDAAGTGTHEATGLQYHSGAWYTFGSGSTTGSGTETMELLPGNYYFKMCYANQSQQKGSMNINVSQTVNFQTVVVTQHLDDGTNGLSGGVAQYHSNTWYNFGVTDANGDVSMELLPGNYYFKMTYATKTKQKGSMNITSATTVNYYYDGNSISRVVLNEPKNQNMNSSNNSGDDVKLYNNDFSVKSENNVKTENTVKPEMKVVDASGVFPNPATNTTTLSYTLNTNSDITVKVYNNLGQEVINVQNQNQEAGMHLMNLDFTDLAEGIYYIKLFSSEGVIQIPVMINH